MHFVHGRLIIKCLRGPIADGVATCTLRNPSVWLSMSGCMQSYQLRCSGLTAFATVSDKVAAFSSKTGAVACGWPNVLLKLPCTACGADKMPFEWNHMRTFAHGSCEKLVSPPSMLATRPTLPLNRRAAARRESWLRRALPPCTILTTQPASSRSNRVDSVHDMIAYAMPRLHCHADGVHGMFAEICTET